MPDRRDMPNSETIQLVGPAGFLEAALNGPAEPAIRAVVAHPHPLYGGTMDNLVVLETERALLAVGAEVLRFNFRGVGRSEGEHSNGTAERGDLLAAVKLLADRQPGTSVLLAGYSFGAAMCLALLSDGELRSEAIGGLLLLAPPLTHYDFSPLVGTELPLGLIHGEMDALTPADQVRSCVEGRDSTTRHRRVDGAGHDLGTSGDPSGLRAALADVVGCLVETGADRSSLG